MKNLKLSYVLNILFVIAIVILVVKTKINVVDTNVQEEFESKSTMIDTTYEKISLGKQATIYPMPVLVVGSYDKNNVPNMMVVAWGGVSSSVPPMVSVSIRSKRYSYENIVNTKAFTINIASSKFLKEVDYFGNISGRDVNKFETTGLTAVKGDSVNAPYVKEFPLILELKVISIENYGSESHYQIIGEIMDVKIDPDYLNDNNKPDIFKIDPLIYSYGTRNYHRIGRRIGQAGKEWQKIEVQNTLRDDTK